MLKKLSGIPFDKLVTYGLSLASMLSIPAVQFVLFAFYARVLGVTQYGVYIILMVWAPICLEIVALGAGEVMIKRASRDPNTFSNAAGHFYAAIAVTLPIALAIYLAITIPLVGAALPWQDVVIVGLCELLGYRLLVGAENGAIALRRVGWANQFRILQAFPRALGVFFAFYVLGAHSTGQLAIAGSAGVLIGGLAAAALAYVRFPRPRLALDTHALRDGVWFAGNQMARASQQNIDRVVLSVLIDPGTLALYGAAQRFVQVGILPIQAILRATYPTFFSEGQKGVLHARKYGLKILLVVLGVAAISCIGLWVLSGIIPLVVGHDYNKSVTYMMLLAPSLLLYACNYVGADILTGSDNQRLRTALMVSAIGIQALCFYLLRSGNGLIIAVYVGIGLAAALNWTAVMVLSRREAAKAKTSTQARSS